MFAQRKSQIANIEAPLGGCHGVGFGFGLGLVWVLFWCYVIVVSVFFWCCCGFLLVLFWCCFVVDELMNLFPDFGLKICFFLSQSSPNRHAYGVLTFHI